MMIRNFPWPRRATIYINKINRNIFSSLLSSLLSNLVYDLLSWAQPRSQLNFQFAQQFYLDLAILTIASKLQLFHYDILWKLEKLSEERTPAERCWWKQKMCPAPIVPSVWVINNFINRAQLSLPVRTTGGSLTWSPGSLLQTNFTRLM